MEPQCEYCNLVDKNRCKTQEVAKKCKYYIGLLYISETPNISLKDDFGFTFEDDNLQEQKITSDKKLSKIYTSILSFLDNLARDPEKKTIVWPDRAEKIAQYKQKLKAIMEGNE